MEVGLSGEQKKMAERTYPDLPKEKAHEKFLAAFKNSRYNRTYSLPGDKLEDMV
jgi:hypothetical protein